MKKIILFFIAINVFAVNADQINRFMSNKEYAKVCTSSIYNTAVKNRDEGLLNTYGLACLKLDHINRLSNVITVLRNTKEARENAVYYSTIFYKKKLLHSALVDGFDIANITLPKCDYILSDIYDDYILGNYEKKDDKYIFKYGDKSYELSLKYEQPFTKMVLKVINDSNQVIDTKEYW